MSADYDIIVIGSGFGGSLIAMIGRSLGKSVLLLERGKHPRFAIGESTTPLSNLLLEELATRYRLPNLLPFCKWGIWQQTYPQLSCGLKRGFTFYHHRPGHRAATDPERRDQLLVAASPHDAIGDTHWYRADVDGFFVRQAQEVGVDYLDEAQLDSAAEGDAEVRLEGQRRGRPLALRARFVVDATGPRGFLCRALSLGEAPLPDFPATEALYTHFSNVHRLDAGNPAQGHGAPPYRVDDAAVHHVFAGGWIWVLRFANGLTSAGVAATRAAAERLGLREGPAGWQRLIQTLPTVWEQFEEARPEMPFIGAPRLSFRSGTMASRRWALLPSAAGFVDPLLSTGFPLTLLGVARLAAILERDWESVRLSSALAGYARQTDGELLAAARLIGSLYAAMANFPLFADLTLLYFAAASYSETARRLGRPHLARTFLLHDNPAFPAQALLRRVRADISHSESQVFQEEIRRAIEPFNVAGLGDPARRNWYPAEANDLLNAAHKLGVTGEEVARMLQRCGFQAAPKQ